MGIIPYITGRVVKRMTAKTVLPWLLMFLGWVSFVVYLSLSSDGGKHTYSHSSYVAFGIFIGLFTASLVSSVVFWLLKDRNQEPHR
jgi:hypothetical protein